MSIPMSILTSTCQRPGLVPSPRERRAREAADLLRKQEEEKERCGEEEQLWQEASEMKLRCAMQDLHARGYPTLFSFINAFLETKDPILSS